MTLEVKRITDVLVLSRGVDWAQCVVDSLNPSMLINVFISISVGVINYYNFLDIARLLYHEFTDIFLEKVFFCKIVNLKYLSDIFSTMESFKD